MRRWLSSVPSPRRSVQSVAWSRWYEVSFTALAAIGRDLRVGRRGERLPLRELVRRAQQLADDRGREVAVLLLDEQAVDELALVAHERVVILRPAGAVELGGARVQAARLTEQVERDVGQRDVVLECRCPRRPLREPVREHQAVVSEAQRVHGRRAGDHEGHSCCTSFGIE